MGKAAAIAATIVIVIIVIVGGLFYYSYTQIQVNLNDVKFHSIDWTSFSWSTLLSLGLNVFAGNWLGAAFDLIDGVNLTLIFGLSNNGFLPIYIPDLSYDLLVNGVYVGNGYTRLDTTINPGETREIPAFQNFKKSSLAPAVTSIVSKNGIMEINVKGTAYFQLFSLSIPIPFESSKQISIYDEIRNRLNSEIQKQQEVERRAAAAKAASAAKAAASAAATLEQSLMKAAKSLQEQLFGSPYDLDLKLPGNILVDDVYKVSPGGYRYYWFTIQCTAKIQGGFIASAALGNNIVAFILNDDEFKLLEKGKPFRAHYNSGKVQSGVFDVTLSPGKYYILFSNTYSTVSTKNVQVQASKLCV